MRFSGKIFFFKEHSLRTRLSFLLLFLVVCSLGASDSLRVATYNLENYLVMDRRVEGKWRPEYPKPEIEKAAVRRAICSANPDILAVQEIGGASFLRELQKDLKRDGIWFPHVVELKAADSTRRVAFLSKVPFKDIIHHTDLDFKYFENRQTVRRGMLEVLVQPAKGFEVSIFLVHLKSRMTVLKEDPNAEKQRVREAEACRNRIIERTRGKRPYYIILGDFNDDPDSATYRRFDHRGDYQISKLLPARDSRGEVWTYFYDRKSIYSKVDWVLASPALTPFFESAHIVDILKPNEGSDHRLVYADFILR